MQGRWEPAWEQPQVWGLRESSPLAKPPWLLTPGGSPARGSRDLGGTRPALGLDLVLDVATELFTCETQRFACKMQVRIQERETRT